MNSDGLSFFLNRPIFLLKYCINGLKLIINYPLVLFKRHNFCYTASLMLKKYQKKLRSLFSSNKKRAQTVGKRLLRFVDKKPVSSFLMLLFALVALIALSNIIRKPTIKESQTVKEPKTVSVYRIGGAPRKASLLEDLAASRRRWSSLPVLDSRSAEEILGYDETGLPR